MSVLSICLSPHVAFYELCSSPFWWSWWLLSFVFEIYLSLSETCLTSRGIFLCLSSAGVVLKDSSRFLLLNRDTFLLWLLLLQCFFALIESFGIRWLCKESTICRYLYICVYLWLECALFELIFFSLPSLCQSKSISLSSGICTISSLVESLVNIGFRVLIAFFWILMSLAVIINVVHRFTTFNEPRLKGAFCELFKLLQLSQVL